MLVDLSVGIEEGMAKIPFLPDVHVEILRALADGHPLEIRNLSIATHIGTHMDAPAHAFAGAATIDEVPLEAVCGEGVVIKVAARPNEAITLADVRAGGPEIREGDIVLLDTGFAKLALTNDPGYLHNPYLSQDLADELVAKKVKVLGVDAVTVDMPVAVRPPDFAYPIHRTLLGNNVLIVENLGDLSAVAGKRLKIYAFPLKIKGSDAGHVRVVAEV
jgi:kynurenine formamidase